MTGKPTKFPAAAVIIIAALITTSQLSCSKSPANTAQPDIIKNIDQNRTFTCKSKQQTEGMKSFGMPPKADSTIYYSSSFGIRVDTYLGKRKLMTQFQFPKKNEIITIVPRAKAYLRTVLLSEDIFDTLVIHDPHTFIKEFMSFEQTKLGQKTIDGITAEGFEVTDTLLFSNSFEKLSARLWIDPNKNLPVMFEIDGSTDAGQIKQTSVFDGFQWNVPLEPNLFEPDIPDNYVLLAEVKLDNKSQPMAIEGLRNFAAYAEGIYPSNLTLPIAWKEIIQAWQASINWQRKPPSQQQRIRNRSIHSTCLFYAKLCKQDKDPAYYGSFVTADDDNAVLMRWKSSDDKYRVIFADLTAKNISAKQLAAIENSPEFKTLMQRPPRILKVEGTVGINPAKWPVIKAIPEMPAAKAGLKNGDEIIRLNGTDASQIETANDALDILRGPAGQTLSITVKREEKILDFDIERAPLSK